MKSELALLARLLTYWLTTLAVATIVLFSVTLQPVSWGGLTLWLPQAGDASLAALAFLHLASVLTPAGVELVVLSPTAAFAAQVLVAFGLAFLLTLPGVLVGLVRYLTPALRASERRAVYLIGSALLALLAAGVYFSYAVISPYTIKVLYTFTTPLGVTPLLGVSEMIATFTALTITTALLFSVPVGMVLLTWMRLLPAAWWWGNARYALVGFLVLSAIITPDGTGVSMLLLTAPVSVLYGVGIIVSTKVEQATLTHRD